MEKNRKSGPNFLNYRLLASCLIIFIFLPSLCFGAVPFSTLLRSLKIIPEQSFCFVGDTCNFVLEIPEYLPSRIDMTVQSTPDGVALMSLSKEGYEKDGVSGTRIVLAFKFSKKGTYKIPSLAMRVDWWSYYVPFQSITVYDDPRTLLPEISVKLPKNVYAQEAFLANVSVRFFSDIIEVYSDLDENAIIKKIEDKEFLDGERGEFSEDFYDVATFEVTAIEAGSFSLPSFHVLAQTYAGGQVLLSSQPQVVKVQSAKKKNSDVTEESYYESILKSPEEASSEPVDGENPLLLDQGSLPEDIASEIMGRRKNEKNLFYLFLALFILSIAAIVFFIRKHKTLLLKIAVILGVLFLVSALVFFVLSSVTEGVVLCDSTIYSIPEQKSSSASSIQAGEVITIKSVITDWYSVRLVNGSEGWIKSTDCIYCGD